MNEMVTKSKVVREKKKEKKRKEFTVLITGLFLRERESRLELLFEEAFVGGFVSDKIDGKVQSKE